MMPCNIDAHEYLIINEAPTYSDDIWQPQSYSLRVIYTVLVRWPSGPEKLRAWFKLSLSWGSRSSQQKHDTHLLGKPASHRKSQMGIWPELETNTLKSGSWSPRTELKGTGQGGSRMPTKASDHWSDLWMWYWIGKATRAKDSFKW